MPVDGDVSWTCHGKPEREENRLTWPNGTALSVSRGSITAWDPIGKTTDMRVGMGKLPLHDPWPTSYPTATAAPEEGMFRVEVKVDRGVEIDAGGELLSRAADLRADLLVMGAYGRSRFRELVMGGASRTVIDAMTVPVLLSH